MLCISIDRTATVNSYIFRIKDVNDSSASVIDNIDESCVRSNTEVSVGTDLQRENRVVATGYGYASSRIVERCLYPS